jgi:hypothetical protein
MVENCPSDPSPKETSSLDLHHQERSNQADATSTDGVCTVCSHTHSIITSSNARAGELVKVAEHNYFCQWLEPNFISREPNFIRKKKKMPTAVQRRVQLAYSV